MGLHLAVLLRKVYSSRFVYIKTKREKVCLLSKSIDIGRFKGDLGVVYWFELASSYRKYHYA